MNRAFIVMAAAIAIGVGAQVSTANSEQVIECADNTNLASACRIPVGKSVIAKVSTAQHLWFSWDKKIGHRYSIVIKDVKGGGMAWGNLDDSGRAEKMSSVPCGGPLTGFPIGSGEFQFNYKNYQPRSFDGEKNGVSVLRMCTTSGFTSVVFVISESQI